jgi:glycosyltransferase involved in cell wall biosynthesis
MFVSIVIPTHNRRIHVLRAVEALMNQDYSRVSYEVIVCCDRCTDGTEQALQSRFANQVDVVRSAVPGQAGALNTGWRRARGELIIFLDDEMEAVKDFITAHARAHLVSEKTEIAVTGYSPVVLGEDATPIIRELARGYEDYFEKLGRSDHKSTPLDMCGCNFSIPVASLRELGGFNESYYFQRNDFELAVRLLENGHELRFSRAAQADNWLAIDADILIRRASERAHNDYRLAQEHPWCLEYLQFYRPLHYPGARRRWRVMWEVCNVAAVIANVLRKLSPNNLRLYNLEYVARYCAALKQEVGCWHKFSRLRELIEKS